MWTFLKSLVKPDESGSGFERENAPELVVRVGGAEPTRGTPPTLVDEENGRTFVVDENDSIATSATAPRQNATSNAHHDDADVDDKGSFSLFHTVELGDGGGGGGGVGGGTDGGVGQSDDGDESDEEHENSLEQDYYRDLSDSEPDSDFISGCYEYFQVDDLCYVVRCVNSGRADILAHESTPLVAFCYALGQRSEVIMQETLMTQKAATRAQVAVDISSNHVAPLGVVGWFVKNVLNGQPVFAFDDGENENKKFVVDLTDEIAEAVNPAVVASGVEGNVGIALLANGNDFVERAKLAWEISSGMRLETAVDVLQHTFARKYLRRFDRRGQTAPINSSGGATSSTDNATSGDDGFQPFSPVENGNGRWFVITPSHYALFRSNELLTIRSGASLSRLSWLLDNGRSVFTVPTPTCTEKQERAVLTRYLESEVASQERQRDNERTKLINTLRSECGKLVNYRERLTQIKTVKSLLPGSDSDDDVLKFVSERLEILAGTLKQLDDEQKSRF